MYAGALHNTTVEIHHLLAAWNAFLAEFKPVFILGADGRKHEALVRTSFNATGTNHKWFGVTDISEGEDYKILVNEGRIAAADTAGIESDPPEIAALMKQYVVDEAEFSVSDGSKVYLKITTTSTEADHEYTSEGGDTNGDAEGDGGLGELLTVETTVKSKTWTGTEGTIVVQPGVAVSTSDVSYVLIAEILIEDGTMIIKQRHDGVVTPPSVSGAFGADPVLTGVTREDDICEDGTAITLLHIAKAID